jgi:hypothetical protein
MIKQRKTYLYGCDVFHTHMPHSFAVITNKYVKLFLLIVSSHYIVAQTYPPPAGFIGTTAMFKDSIAFVNWVSDCKVNRGFQDVSNISLGRASVGDSSLALGLAQSNGVVSLGDGGFAICQFPYPIKDELGNDFAVFENSFDGLFLELAFVEVSSDGLHFFRFPSHSLTDTAVQVGPFNYLDATKLNNLAGKYINGYGTPFDLSDLPNNVLLNKNNITHVKIIDCVGSLNKEFASIDSYGNKINDPWPTPFFNSGFDLDAIGVIHQNSITNIDDMRNQENLISVFPNPLNTYDKLTVLSSHAILLVELYNAVGHKLIENKGDTVMLNNITSGLYYLKIKLENRTVVKKIIVN